MRLYAEGTPLHFVGVWLYARGAHLYAEERIYMLNDFSGIEYCTCYGITIYLSQVIHPLQLQLSGIFFLSLESWKLKI